MRRCKPASAPCPIRTGSGHGWINSNRCASAGVSGWCRAGTHRATRRRETYCSTPASPSAPAPIPPPRSVSNGWTAKIFTIKPSSTSAAARASSPSPPPGWVRARCGPWITIRRRCSRPATMPRPTTSPRKSRAVPQMNCQHCRPTSCSVYYGSDHRARRMGPCARPAHAGQCRLTFTSRTANSAMYTQCPQCETLFRISAVQLAQARGTVRCGVCAHAFDAMESLSERPEPLQREASYNAPPAAQPDSADTPPDASTDLEPVAAPIELVTAVALDAGDADGLHIPAPETAADDIHSPLPQQTIAQPHDAIDLPTFKLAAERPVDAAPWISAEARNARLEPQVGTREVGDVLGPTEGEDRSASMPSARPRNHGGVQTVAWGIANVALIVMLLGQYTYFHRDELAQYPELRPWLARLCDIAACDVPLRKDAARISLMNRVVQSHPQHDNALLIDATLVNEAGYTQPYPLLDLRFSDLNNRLVAGRRFRPEEYLPPGTPVAAGMPPKQPVKFSLELADPGKEAVSFQFNLL